MVDVRTESDPATGDVVRLVVAHAVAVAVPVLVIAAFLVPLLLALLIAVVIGVAVTALRMRRIDDRIASTIGAVRIADGARPRLESVTESVAMAVGVAPPELHVIDVAACNAIVWADGTGPVRCAFTTGLLDSMDRIQLEAVVGHQLAVVRNGGLDVVTLGAALLGPVAKGPLEPAVAWFVHRTIRARSVVVADIEGSRATKFPPGLVSALEAIRGGPTDVASIPPTLSVLCFAAPDHDPGPFAVHPPIEDRIDLLREV